MAFGRFQSRPTAPPLSDINVTPLVDVMLVLVVIFILTAPLLATRIALDLPSSDAAQPGNPARFVTLAVTPAGAVFLDDQPTSLPDLAIRLAETARSQPDTEVQLRADATVPYGRVVEVMGVAQKAGLSRIGFVAETGLPARTAR